MDDTNKTCRAFLNDLSSASPTPGGGGAAALCGAVGAALCGMVAHLTTGKKTYSVPEGATVTVTLDKTLVPEGMVFDIWSTGKFSLPLGQDYKAESITCTMNAMSSDADIAAHAKRVVTIKAGILQEKR